MPYIVTEGCINYKYTDCVEVCPVDCFYEGLNFLVISPGECTDCNTCVPTSPTEAIYADDELPPEFKHFAVLNRVLAESWMSYNITDQKEPMSNAEENNRESKSSSDILNW